MSVGRYVDRVRDAAVDLECEIDNERHRFERRVQRGRVWFDRELREAHRRLRQSIPAYILEGSVISLLTAPVIYSLLLPFVLLDFWVTLYQSICFPVYGIARVPRRRFFAIDRHKLAYLNGIEKLNCTYCSYANGLIAYIREVAARTEQYWCPIRHARTIPSPHSRYDRFFEYGDAARYRRGLMPLRATLRRGAPRRHRVRVARPRRRPAT